MDKKLFLIVGLISMIAFAGTLPGLATNRSVSLTVTAGISTLAGDVTYEKNVGVNVKYTITINSSEAIEYVYSKVYVKKASSLLSLGTQYDNRSFANATEKTFTLNFKIDEQSIAGSELVNDDSLQITTALYNLSLSGTKYSESTIYLSYSDVVSTETTTTSENKLVTYSVWGVFGVGMIVVFAAIGLVVYKFWMTVSDRLD